MSRHFKRVFRELNFLQSNLQDTCNRLWNINIAISDAYQHGAERSDFLPRRLLIRKREEQVQFEKLVEQLQRTISIHLDSSLLVFDNVEDQKDAIRIRKTIRYIQNAFAHEPPLQQAWIRLNQVLS